jgi:hypothetical protein
MHSLTLQISEEAATALREQLKPQEGSMHSLTLQISEEAATALREQLGRSPAASWTDPMVGGKWFIRTVTFHHVGLVVRRVGEFLVLKDASWVADSGRFMDALKNGALSEVEPVGDALVNVSSIVDAFPWIHDLPTRQK